MTMSSVEFGYLQHLVRRHSGIVLEPGKEYLAESRLLPLARLEGFETIDQMIARLRLERPGGLHWKVVEAMTTKETSFFREFHTFEVLKIHLLRDLLERRSSSRELNIWCAACSSGQEPYSLAMLLRHEFPELSAWKVFLLGSDISAEALDRGRAGVYSQIEINRGLPARMLTRFFRKQGIDWKIDEEVRRMVDLRQINLAEPWPPLPSMDLILLRNVLVYFDHETRRSVLDQVSRRLKRDGYLLLGGAEATLRLGDEFQRVEADGATVWRLRES